MSKSIRLQDAAAEKFSDTITTYRLLTEKLGTANGFSAGVTVFSSGEYNAPGIHKDQEGFFVLEGKGYALVNGEEIRLEEGTAFYVGKGVAHSIKRDEKVKYVKVFWFHGAP